MNQQATVNTFTEHLNLSSAKVESLLTLSATELPQQEEFQTELGTLDLSLLHRPVPPVALEQAIPRLVSLFNNVEDGQIRQQWQSAVALLYLVLAADAREQLRVKSE